MLGSQEQISLLVVCAHVSVFQIIHLSFKENKTTFIHICHFFT